MFNVPGYRAYRPPARARFAYRPGRLVRIAEVTGSSVLASEDEPEREQHQPVAPETLLAWIKTLADEARLRMLGLLAEQKRSVEELAALLDLRPSTVSWHLARLKEIDLVAMQAEGNTHVYRLNGKGLGRINKLLAAPERVAVLDDVEAQAWERKVLQDLLAGAYAKALPAYRKKRQIILRWLVKQFEEGRR
jgi:DNA-binding transcriptional ArsR family regulator